MRLALFVVLAALVSGCIQSADIDGETLDTDGATSADGPDPHAAHAADATPWSVALSDCHEAGSVAAYNRDGFGIGGSHVPEPWTLADVRAELGDPKVSSLGEPMLGAVTGHWHMAISCTELDFGYVGVSVEAPPFDWGGADRHILFSGLSFADDEVRKRIAALAGFVPTRTLSAEVQSLAPDTLYAALDDEVKGVYEGWGPVFEIQTKPTHTVRWWTTVPDGNDQVPVALDVTYDAPTRHAATGESSGVGCHTRTEMHGPQGGSCQLGLIVSYESANVTLSYGGRANETVAHAWHH